MTFFQVITCLQSQKNMGTETTEINEISALSENGKQNYSSNDFKDFGIRYAKSGTLVCVVCEKFIAKNDIKIFKKDDGTERALHYGSPENWHHVECFVKVREKLQFFARGSFLPGFRSLSPDDQNLIDSIILEIQKDNVDIPPPKKLKMSVPIGTPKEMDRQFDVLFKYRQKLEEMKEPELVRLLQHNDQIVPEGISEVSDRLADALTFGALMKCGKCDGQYVFQSGVGYKCLGREGVRCENRSFRPPRVAFEVPTEYKETYTFLRAYKCNIADRLLAESASEFDEETKNETIDVKNISGTYPIENLNFFIHKVDRVSTENMKLKISSLGGNIVKKFCGNISAVISTEEELKKTKLVKVLQSSKNLDIPILSAAFFDSLCHSTSRDELIRSFRENTISSWGMDAEKIITEAMVPKKRYRKKSRLLKSEVSGQLVKLKGSVDPNSKLDKVAHVYQLGKDIYSAVLCLTDMQGDENSFYKLQILEDDEKKRYWCFRSWGLLGTTFYGTNMDTFFSAKDCVDLFKKLFEERTGNLWELRDNFIKIAGKMVMLKDRECP